MFLVESDKPDIKDTNVHESLPLCMCASFPYGPKSGMWGLIVLVSDHCLFLLFFLSCIIRRF